VVPFNATGSTLVPNVTGGVWTRYWSRLGEGTVDAAVNAGPGFVNGSTGKSQATPPSPVMPRAIRISIRVYDRTAGEIRQQSVIQELTR